MDEDKKPRGKKYKEKVERPKTQKKDKRKSLEDPDNSRGSDKEEEEETTLVVGRSLVNNFQENIYVLTAPGAPGENNPAGLFRNLLTDGLAVDTKSREQLVEDSVAAGSSSSPQSSFTKVTSKKSRGRRGKEEVGKPPPPPVEPQKPLQRSREQDRNKPEKDSSKPRGDRDEACKTPSPLPEKEKFPKLEKSDFPALPGGGGEVKSLPGPWARGWSKASDATADNNTEPTERPATDNTTEVQKSPPAVCDEVSAVIVSSVPSSEEDLASEESDKNNNNNPTCDEKVSVVTCPEEFEKKVVNKDSPVVIFSEEQGQNWTSSEFTFGFDVNEELMATATSSTTDSSNAPLKVEEPRPEIFLPFHTVAPIDSMDGAILEFGVAANNMRPLIVGVPVGVPVPASSFPLYSNHIVQPFPPFSGLTYPNLSGADGASEDPAAISPESGISSSSPLSWQPECSPQLAATLPPLHSQVTESLSNWSGHLSEEETDQDSGLVPCKTENRFNFVEIVNFVSATWSTVSADNEVQVFSSGPGAF